jgi:hypothetical protein
MKVKLDRIRTRARLAASATTLATPLAAFSLRQHNHTYTLDRLDQHKYTTLPVNEKIPKKYIL